MCFFIFFFCLLESIFPPNSFATTKNRSSFFSHQFSDHFQKENADKHMEGAAGDPVWQRDHFGKVLADYMAVKRSENKENILPVIEGDARPKKKIRTAPGSDGDIFTAFAGFIQDNLKTYNNEPLDQLYFGLACAALLTQKVTEDDCYAVGDVPSFIDPGSSLVGLEGPRVWQKLAQEGRWEFLFDKFLSTFPAGKTPEVLVYISDQCPAPGESVRLMLRGTFVFDCHTLGVINVCGHSVSPLGHFLLHLNHHTLRREEALAGIARQKGWVLSALGETRMNHEAFEGGVQGTVDRFLEEIDGLNKEALCVLGAEKKPSINFLLSAGWGQAFFSEHAATVPMSPDQWWEKQLFQRFNCYMRYLQTDPLAAISKGVKQVDPVSFSDPFLREKLAWKTGGTADGFKGNFWVKRCEKITFLLKECAETRLDCIQVSRYGMTDQNFHRLWKSSYQDCQFYYPSDETLFREVQAWLIPFFSKKDTKKWFMLKALGKKRFCQMQFLTEWLKKKSGALLKKGVRLSVQGTVEMENFSVRYAEAMHSFLYGLSFGPEEFSAYAIERVAHMIGAI